MLVWSREKDGSLLSLGAQVVKAVSGIHTHSLVCFPVMLPKPLINESLALVSHAEGQSHESVYFQMHENTPLRAE